MKKRDFTSVLDLSYEEIIGIFKSTKKLKKNLKEKIFSNSLKNKTLGMIFEKSSTRTRISFEVGARQLGGSAIFLSSKDIQLGRGESIEDTAKVLSRYVDIVMARTYSHKTIEDLAKHSSIPIINGLSDILHPCQAMADFYSIWERFSSFKGLKFTYIGDASNNMSNSLMLLSAKLGVDFYAISPKEYIPDSKILKIAQSLASKSESIVNINDKLENIKNSNIVYTDVWTSMGQEKEMKKRHSILKPYQVNEELTLMAKKDFIFMHCLPAHRGEEVTGAVIDGENSIVFDQAENRLHVQKAIMEFLIKSQED